MWVVAYIAAIVVVNWMFLALPPVASPVGDIYYANFIVGAIFVLRDYAQRQISHYILLATLFAGVLTYSMVDEKIATASMVAFLLSESVDWAIFSFTRRPLQERILLSSLVAAPVDTLAFQYLAGYLSPAAYAVEVASKLLGVLVLWWLIRARQLRAA